MKTITVITPTLGKRPKGFERAVRSVNEQFGDFAIEHLIVCPSATILPSMQDSERVRRTIKYFDIPGIYQAMNYGVQEATGNYFVFLGDDDFLLASSLEMRLTALESNDYDFLYSKSFYEDHFGNLTELTMTTDPSKDWFLDLLKFQHASVIFSERCKYKFGDYLHTYRGLKLGICSDYLWFAQAFDRNAIFGYIEKNTVVIGTGGASSSRIIKTYLEGFWIAIFASSGHERVLALRSWTKMGIRRGYAWFKRIGKI
jgi:glycosyltransferase involved in cell wall biosynthesis